MKFYITNHCKNRYRERVLGNSNTIKVDLFRRYDDGVKEINDEENRS